MTEQQKPEAESTTSSTAATKLSEMRVWLAQAAEFQTLMDNALAEATKIAEELDSRREPRLPGVE
mgnify:CR=1 FL=1